MPKLTEKEIERRVLAAMGTGNTVQPTPAAQAILPTLLNRANQVKQQGVIR